ncbi:hypothetical protein HMPREF0970_02333 [Schaalia odontolytica F0309]|uniref:Uncharacterized protein n=1 Tax=Schaalia odontolytica F0309 TaxID=649742 RepID=D4U277_9ACTO|nr:hypothetical protein HMPREF0970_02333 [Schaalia odontolytica F0309]
MGKDNRGHDAPRTEGVGQGRDVRSPWGHYIGNGAQVRQFYTEMGAFSRGCLSRLTACRRTT